MELYHQRRIIEDSALFDAHWFEWRYRDLLTQNGLSSEDDLLGFFLENGSARSLDPNRNFDTSLYLQTRPEAVETKLNPLVHAIVYDGLNSQDNAPVAQGQAAPMPAVVYQIEDWQKAIRDAAWQVRIGQVAEGERKLHDLLETPFLPVPIRASAAQSLATGLDLRGKTNEALALLNTQFPQALEQENAPELPSRYLPLMGQLALKLGKRSFAQSCFERQLSGGDQSAHIGLALCAEDAADTLAHLNTLYEAGGLQPVTCSVDDTLGLDTLRGVPKNDSAFTPVNAAAGPPQVSVIMPVYNAASTIATAMRSLLAQTLRDIEIIIVDDASTDGTVKALQPFLTDPRVRLFAQDKNAGAYAARNLGLEAATGHYVTTHDADDWSHPEKLNLQLDALRQPGCRASISDWLRVSADLTDLRRWLCTGRFVVKNHSSFMAKREDLLKLGGWLPLRVAADSDLIDRFLAHFGPECMTQVAPEVPLSLARAEATSLTSIATTHAATKASGLRRNIAEICSFWSAMGVTTQHGEGAALRQRALAAMDPATALDAILMVDLSSPHDVATAAAWVLEFDETAGIGLFPITWPANIHSGPEADRRFCDAAGFLMANTRTCLLSQLDEKQGSTSVYLVDGSRLSLLSFAEAQDVAQRNLPPLLTSVAQRGT